MTIKEVSLGMPAPSSLPPDQSTLSHSHPVLPEVQFQLELHYCSKSSLSSTFILTSCIFITKHHTRFLLHLYYCLPSLFTKDIYPYNSPRRITTLRYHSRLTSLRPPVIWFLLLTIKNPTNDLIPSTPAFLPSSPEQSIPIALLAATVPVSPHHDRHHRLLALLHCQNPHLSLLPLPNHRRSQQQQQQQRVAAGAAMH